MFLVVGHQVCTHLRRDFVPLLFADPLQVIKVSRLTFGNSNLQLPLQIFYGIKVWRLARPLQDLSVLLLEPLIRCLGCVFWVIVMLEYPSTTHFQCPGWLQCPDPDGTWPLHHPFDAVQLSCNAVVHVTPPGPHRPNSYLVPSGSRTRDSHAGGGRSNKERQRLQPLASSARAPLFEVRRVRFYTQPLLAYIRYTRLAERHPQSIMFPPPCLVGMVFLGS